MGGQMSCTSPQSDSDRDFISPRTKPTTQPTTTTRTASMTKKEQLKESQQQLSTSQQPPRHSISEASTSQTALQQQSSAALALASHVQPASSSTQQVTHPLRASNSYQALGPMVYVSCATSRIGISTIRGLRLNFPSIKIRAGVRMNENKSDVARMFREAHLDDIDCVQVDPRKRQSLIWALVGVQALLVIPSGDSNVRTALAHVQAAKTAGVALVTVVTIPADHATPGAKKVIDTSAAAAVPHVVERYTLKTKLGCCFMRLPEELVDDIIFPAPSSSSSFSSPITSTSTSTPCPESGAPKFHLSDVGTACATILANHQQHLFTRYDLQAADADNKRKYEAAHPVQAPMPVKNFSTDSTDSTVSSTNSSPESRHQRLGAGTRRGSTASTVTDVSDYQSAPSSPEPSHSAQHSHSHSNSGSTNSSVNSSPIQAH